MNINDCLQIQEEYVGKTIQDLKEVKETIQFYKDKNVPLIPELNEIEKIDNDSLLGLKKTSKTVTIGRKLTRAYLLRILAFQIIFSIIIGMASSIGYTKMKINDPSIWGIATGIFFFVVMIMEYALNLGMVGMFMNSYNPSECVEFRSEGIAFPDTNTFKGRMKYAWDVLLGKEGLQYVKYSDIQDIQQKHALRYIHIPNTNLSTETDAIDYQINFKDGRMIELTNPVLLENDREIIETIIQKKVNGLH